YSNSKTAEFTTTLTQEQTFLTNNETESTSQFLMSSTSERTSTLIPSSTASFHAQSSVVPDMTINPVTTTVRPLDTESTLRSSPELTTSINVVTPVTLIDTSTSTFVSSTDT